MVVDYPSTTFLELLAANVPATLADMDDLVRDVGFKPATPIEGGVDAVYHLTAIHRELSRVFS